MNYNKYHTDDCESALLNGSYSEEIHFSGRSQNYCVLFVDMVDSTKITAEISDAEKVRKYFSMYLNTMASVLRRNNARIIKNVGDSLISYFPNTSDTTNENAFEDVLECGIDMIVASPVINEKLYKDEGLPSLNYRISADYGQVEMAKSRTSQSFDLFGSTINLCSKINSHAQPGGMVIGGDLYRLVKSFNKLHTKYHFKQVGEYTIGFAGKITIGNFGGKYPIYKVNFLDTRNRNHDGNNNIFSTNTQRPDQFQPRLDAMKKMVMPSSYSKEEKPRWSQQKYTHNLML
ncbi:MAG TPA: adenylate/guanylate cyclase domain-containing protein, partial [Nitrososphaeraceae archaeon]|nr:adenylate/guanylate cyclase domain-containing protein [Nitrososphaeraceae archaeon]